MSFAFNLGGDDIDLDDDDLEVSSKAQDAEALLQEISTHPVKTYLIGDKYIQDDSVLSLLASLPSGISYESVEIPRIDENEAYGSFQLQPIRTTSLVEHQNIASVLRRPTYDILLQLKAEADSDANQNAELISAMEGNDRQFGVYEGGLKTWEGALDLAALVRGLDFESRPGDWHIIELGAGSAIPSMVALKQSLMTNREPDLTETRSRFHFSLSDYNDEVLRLSTFANVLLASQEELNQRERGEVQNSPSIDGSIDIEEGLITSCRKLWQQAGVSFNFISGPWGKDFQDATLNSALGGFSNVLILASETIYDLKSLSAFTDTVMNILRAHGQSARAWIAAKKLYFGVGGGVDAFVHEVEVRGGVVGEILNINQGVSRVVLEVTYQQP